MEGRFLAFLALTLFQTVFPTDTAPFTTEQAECSERRPLLQTSTTGVFPTARRQHNIITFVLLTLQCPAARGAHEYEARGRQTQRSPPPPPRQQPELTATDKLCAAREKKTWRIYKMSLICRTDTSARRQINTINRRRHGGSQSFHARKISEQTSHPVACVTTRKGSGDERVPGHIVPLLKGPGSRCVQGSF